MDSRAVLAAIRADGWESEFPLKHAGLDRTRSGVGPTPSPRSRILAFGRRSRHVASGVSVT